MAPRAPMAPALNASLLERLELTPTLARFRIRPDGGPVPFIPGQYVPIGLGDGERAPRPYSIASRPGRRDLEFIISMVPGGQLTSRLFALDTGKRLHVGQPRGLFRLDHHDVRDHLFVGSGSGVAPLLAMISALGQRQQPPRAVLLHGARTQPELAAAKEPVAAAAGWLTYRPVLSRPRSAHAWRGRTGRVTDELGDMCAAGRIIPKRTVAYICGNPQMVEACRNLLAAAGLAEADIRSERFTTD